ncbi:hypothetical protein [Adhaeribacter aquaticus]|uniref:hypothetical protein n=1 Tax=Adhaeribacter aquaticus TaxID=299567 RepID=UPI00047CABA3|nr:hypothetical protein [Adhaeribacter aquaticus]
MELKDNPNGTESRETFLEALKRYKPPKIWPLCCKVPEGESIRLCPQCGENFKTLKSRQENMPQIIINTKLVFIEDYRFNEPLRDIIERAKSQTSYKDTDISNWTVVSGLNPAAEIDLDRRFQWCYGQIFVNPPIGAGA